MGENMPEENQNPAPDQRLGKKDKDRIAELERVVQALLNGMKEAESSTGDALMPTGEYFGMKFE